MKKGFTFIEVLITIAIVSLLTGYAVVNIIGFQQKADINATLQVILSDIKQQQLKAMQGETEGRPTSSNYGIHFNQTAYVLFHGSTYNVNDSSNFAIDLDPTLSFSSITFPGGDLIFSQGNGEVTGFVAGSNTVTLHNSGNGESHTVTINRYGVITQVN